MIVGRYWLQTLGCPKNQVDSDKLEGYLEAQGYDRARRPRHGRSRRRQHVRLHRGGPPGVDRDRLAPGRDAPDGRAPRRDRLHGRALRRRAARRPPRGRPGGRVRSRPDQRRRADRSAPSPSPSAPPAPRRTPARPTPSTSSSCPARRPARRGPTSRSPRAVTASAASAPSRPSGASSARGRRTRCWPRSTPSSPPAPGAPPLREIVLVAQDLASYGRDRSGPGRRTRTANGPSPIAALTRAVSARVERTRLLYLYPSGLTDELIEAVLKTGVPYFDLSLQHVSRPLLARMRRWGDGERFLRRIADIRAADAGRHLPLLVHPRLPGRDRARPRPAAAVPARGPARLGRLLPLLQRGGHARRRAGGPGRPRARPRAPARVRRAAGRHHGGQAGRA